MTPPRLLAIVTARAGSKGLPRKHLALLGGKPLVAHSVQAGLSCPAVSRVVVTSDDPAVAEIARQLGAVAIDRPAALATDQARSEDAVRHVLDTLEAAGERFELLALLQPTSPFRTAAHLGECVEQFRASGAACAISVVEDAHPPHKSFVLDDRQGLIPLFGKEVLSRPRQVLPRVYRPNGAIYLIGCDTFRAVDSFYAEPAMPYLMSAAASVDIDSAQDLEWARFLLSSGQPPGS